MITVLLVDDHPVVRSGYRRLLEQAPDISVLAEAADGEEAYQAYSRRQPSIVVMDMALPGISGLEAARRILKRDAHARILMFSAYESEVLIERARETGVKGYIGKRSAAKSIVEATRIVVSGGAFFDKLQKRAESPQAVRQNPVELLTPREFEVFCHLAQGHSVAEIAELLHTSPKTVSVHQTHLMRKLRLTNVVQLTHLALRHGLITLEK
ncbi:regulatory protein, LuxR [Methylocaldum marinum]|uniref:Regulatory protein, LuxR n=1 Tax=Methylocaldum marinum TaxID=1432792 RepID=A0A250L037_9GAMM|nr:response regulator transcription factor [Methylocaldum marinum]BBA37136.1 regulatory protein, LuxR [Methylocaldum marinum]